MPPITTQILLTTNIAPQLINTICNKMKGDQAHQLQFFTLSKVDPAHNALALLGNILDLQRAAKGYYYFLFIFLFYFLFLVLFKISFKL